MTDQERPEDAIPDADQSTHPEAAEHRDDGAGTDKPTRGAADAPSATASATESRPPASPRPSASAGDEAAAASGRGGSESSEEPRYVDDPVSKWWVGIIIAVFGLIFAWAVFFGGGGLFSGLLGGDEPTAAPSPSLVASPSESPSAAVTPAATTTITPAPTPLPSPEPTQAPTLALTPEPTQAPTLAPTPEPTQAPTLEPVASPTG